MGIFVDIRNEYLQDTTEIEERHFDELPVLSLESDCLNQCHEDQQSIGPLRARQFNKLAVCTVYIVRISDFFGKLQLQSA